MEPDEIGWVVTRDFGHESETDTALALTPRTGWGQTRADVENSTVRSINITQEIDPDKIVDPVAWRTYGDGETNPTYEGVICKSWVDGDEGLCGAPLNFGLTDAGDTRLDLKINGEWEQVIS